jgi:hypothetical protein
MKLNGIFLVTLGIITSAQGLNPSHAFALAYEPTPIPTSSAEYSAKIIEGVRIKDQDVLRIERKSIAKSEKLPVEIVAVTALRGAGLSPVALDVRLPNGETFNLLGAPSVKKIQENYMVASKKPYPDNLFFQNGSMAPLFPLANRLTGTPSAQNNVRAKVKGIEVLMPLNNKADIPNAILHHLHGALFGAFAEKPDSRPTFRVGPESASLSGQFETERFFTSTLF